MYGDFLVPNNTNVNNAITTGTGAKWELFFEETRDETGAVGYEWDKDHNDNTPLNINGMLIFIENDNVISAANQSMSISINGKTVVSFTSGIGSNNKYNFYQINIKNNLLYLDLFRSSNKLSPLNTGVTYEARSMFLNSINEFSMSIASVNADTKIKVYVLRGV